MTRAETTLFEGTVDESSFRNLIESSQGRPVYACERQVGGAGRATGVTALLLDDLSQEIPESQIIDIAILVARTSGEMPLLVSELGEINEVVHTLLNGGAKKFLFLEFESSSMENRIALSLLYWLTDQV